MCFFTPVHVFGYPCQGRVGSMLMAHRSPSIGYLFGLFGGFPFQACPIRSQRTGSMPRSLVGSENRTLDPSDRDSHGARRGILTKPVDPLRGSATVRVQVGSPSLHPVEEFQTHPTWILVGYRCFLPSWIRRSSRPSCGRLHTSTIATPFSSKLLVASYLRRLHVHLHPLARQKTPWWTPPWPCGAWKPGEMEERGPSSAPTGWKPRHTTTRAFVWT